MIKQRQKSVSEDTGKVDNLLCGYITQNIVVYRFPNKKFYVSRLSTPYKFITFSALTTFLSLGKRANERRPN